MIELLVVISIIAILMSLSIAVYRDSLENARIQATKATIRQLDAALQDRMEAFDRLKLTSQAQQFKSAYDTANSPNSIPLKVAEIIVRKDRFRGAFPQRVEDLFSFDGTAAGLNAPLWRLWMNRTGATAMVPRPEPIASTPGLESSALLYLALTEGSVFGLPAIELDSINQNHIVTVPTLDGSGNPIGEVTYFIDEWDQPLRFYNWPTRLTRRNGDGMPIIRTELLATLEVLVRRAPTLLPSQPALNANVYSNTLNQDPDDPFGSLSAGFASGGQLLPIPAIGFMGIPDSTVFEQRYHTLDTYYTPLIVSGGSDGETGLNEPSLAGPERLGQPLSITATDFINDNITSRQ